MRGQPIVSVVLGLTLGAGCASEAQEEPTAAGSFVSAGSLAEARWGHTVTALPDGRVLVVGGTKGSIEEGFETIPSAEVWDPTTGSFEAAGSLQEARDSHTATLLPDGRVVIVGGSDADYSLHSSSEVWDPAGFFSRAGSLAEGRSGHTATLLPDGRVLIIGGEGNIDGNYLPFAEVWDPATSRWTVSGRLPEGRTQHSATLLPDGRVLVIGGTTITKGTEGRLYDFPMVDSAQVWDPATGSFSQAGSFASIGHTTTLLPDGRVLVVGVNRYDENDLMRALAVAGLWDPETESFEPTGSPAEARSGHTTTLLPDDRVLVVGGYKIPAMAEVWDPVTGSFGPAGPLTEVRRWHSATLLPDGRVLVIGGTNDDTDSVSAAEVWDPASGSFGPAGALAEARGGIWSTATLLPDGRVLVIGGSGEDWDEDLASAELWVPIEGSRRVASLGD